MRQSSKASEKNNPQEVAAGIRLTDSSVFSGSGEMSELMRSFDWSKNPLGPPESWSPTLQAMTRMLLANSFPMLLWWGPDFLQLYNDAYRPVLGDKHPHAALGRPFRECWSEVFDILGPLAQKPFEGGPPTWMEDIPLEINRFGFLEETHFTIGYSAVPDPTTPGGIGGVLATVHEITQKVLNQRRLSALRELSMRSFEAKTVDHACEVAVSTIAHHSLDIPFALIYLIDDKTSSAHLARETGLTAIPGLRPEVLSLSLAADDVWPLSICRQQDETVVVKGLHRLRQLTHDSSSDFPQMAAIVPIPSNIAGQPVGFLVAGISSRIQLDDSYRGFLELFSAQIATSITNARAYEDERRRSAALAEIDRAKTVFFSNVSHEFRTPLTLMMAPIEAALKDTSESLSELVSLKREHLELTYRNSLRLLKLVNTLLEFSRIEAGRIQAIYEPVDLCALTSEVASVFRSTIERSGVEYKVHCEPLQQPVYVDRDMWEKIVLNLLSNAFKFTLQGSIKVYLHAVGNEAQLAIQDSGTGIAPEDIPRIFERFYRVENSRGRNYEGSGIGLALVQEMVKLHGGQIRVESEPEQGTTFTVSIPFGSEHLPQERVGATRTTSSSLGGDAYLAEAMRWSSAVSAPSSSVFTKSETSLARVLVVDDNNDMRDYLRSLLSGAYQVIAFADGESALQAIVHDPPDLVLTDVMMPKLDGFGLVKAMRANEKTASVPVIVVSARAGEDARIEGAVASVEDYLVKPFSGRELLARVENQLKLARLRHESEQRIRESEERFRALAIASFHSIYRMNSDWSEMRQLSGSGFLIDTNQPTQNWLQNYILAEDQPLVLSAIHDATRTGHMFALEHRVRRSDGSVGWVFSRAIPLLNDRGEITEWFGAASDVTERRLQQENQSRLAAIVDFADDAIISEDLGGTIRTWNSGATEMFGYSAEEAIGRSTQMLIPEELRHEEEQILAQLRTGKRTDHYETVRTTKTGESIDVSITISPIRDASGEITGVSKIARDISDRRRMERLVVQSEKLSATGRMAASIAHEINNPLESLINLIYLARISAATNREAQEYLLTAEEELERVSHLARQTLGYYRDTATPVDVQLHDLISTVLTVYNSKITAAGIVVDLRFDNVDHIVVSKGELLQVLSNIIANAIDAMSGGGRLYIATQKVASQQNAGLEIIVRDTGVGISRDDLPRIFEPFFTTKGDLGTGIGLWVSKQLIEARGGQISVTSNAGSAHSGTTFVLYIPFALPTTPLAAV